MIGKKLRTGPGPGDAEQTVEVSFLEDEGDCPERGEDAEDVADHRSERDQERAEHQDSRTTQSTMMIAEIEWATPTKAWPRCRC